MENNANANPATPAQPAAQPQVVQIPQVVKVPVEDPAWYDKLSAWLYAGVGERYYLYNHILEGTLFGHRDDELGVDLERFVSEFRYGVVLKYDRFYFSYYGVMRTHEFRGQKRSPDYGGLCVGWVW